MDEDFVFFLSFMPKIQGKDVLKSKQSRKPPIKRPFRLWCFRFSPASCFYAREQAFLSSFLFHGRSLLSKSRYFVSSFSRQNFLSFFISHFYPLANFLLWFQCFLFLFSFAFKKKLRFGTFFSSGRAVFIFISFLFAASHPSFIPRWRLFVRELLPSGISRLPKFLPDR